MRQDNVYQRPPELVMGECIDFSVPTSECIKILPKVDGSVPWLGSSNSRRFDYVDDSDDKPTYSQEHAGEARA